MCWSVEECTDLLECTSRHSCYSRLGQTHIIGPAGILAYSFRCKKSLTETMVILVLGRSIGLCARFWIWAKETVMAL